MPGEVIVEHHRGTPAELHGLEVPDDDRMRVWVLEATSPAIVLGSTQADDVVDQEAAARRGVAVVRRRSGGGAVWVAPDEPVWVDVIVPRHDARWHEDVAKAFLPIGRAWSSALDAVGVTGTTVHEGPMVRTRWSGLVCFAGTGPGEVLRAGRKLVGISQRRRRGFARFQCAVPRVWDPEPLQSLLAAPPELDELREAGTGVGDVATDDLVGALRTALA